MNIKNVKKVSDTEYTLELDHPDFGWIPYTAIADSGEEVMEEIFQKVSKMKNVKEDIDVLKGRLQMVHRDSVSKKVRALKSGYNREEIELWETKKAEAEKFLSEGTSELIELEATLNERDPKELAEKIIEKNKLYKKEVLTSSMIAKKLQEDSESIKSIKDYEKLNKKYINLLKVEDGKTD